MNKRKIAVVSFLILVLVIFYVFLVHCPILYITGISCPGCGLTRAIVSACLFKFEQAFFYHPLWPVVPVAVAALWISKVKKPKLIPYIVAVCTVLLIITYVIRLFIGPREIVKIDFENGLIYKIYYWIRSILA